MAYIDYTKFNFCTRCELEFAKAIGSKCPQCKYQARTLPRNPKVFKAKDSEIWSVSRSLEAEN